MDKPKLTPRDFFLWFGAMVFLYLSVFAFISLIFSYLNYAFPDQLAYYSGDPYSSGGVSYEMASLIVFFPIFLVLMRVIRSAIKADPSRSDIWIRRWALYLTLFVAGVTVAGDLVTLLMYFFNGDVTLRFILKVLVVLLVAGGGFLHFLADLRGYWDVNPGKARTIGWATAALVVLTIVLGFFVVGTPWQAREYRYDDQRVGDLMNLQSQIVYYYQAKQVLPGTLGDLTNTISGFIAPVDPKTGAPYEYSVQGKYSFQLCAAFGAPTQPNSLASAPAEIAPAGVGKGTVVSWRHDAGRYCFDRTIDPQLYPPIKGV